MSTSELFEPTRTFFDDAGLPWDDERAYYMRRYLDLLVQFNEAMNLIGPLSRQEVVDQLLFDSVVPAAARRPKGPILDVGTGAGLPGIPLKIAFPDVSLTLVEPRQKRSTFLKIATNRLGLDDVDIFHGRIEEFEESNFDLVISKAFQAPTEWLETAAPFTNDDGAVVCMGREKNRQELLAVAEKLEFELVGEASVGDGGPEQRVCFAFEQA